MVVTPQPIAPTYKITANDKDITAAIAAKFVGLRLTDEVGLQADTLEITLADNDPANRIQTPPKGAELELFLGYDGITVSMGRFVFDEFGRSGWPNMVHLRARAAVYDQTVLGKSDFQTQKSRSWANGTKLVDMVAKMASEHGMKAAVSKSLQTLTLPHFDQTDESDISFLIRALKHYDVIVKPAGGQLIVAKRGEMLTMAGAALPAFNLDAKDCTSWHSTESQRERPGTVVAYYHDIAQAKRIQVSVGSGDPVFRIRHHFPNQSAALQACQAEQNKRTRKQTTFNATLPGNTSAQAEAPLNLTGFGTPDIDGAWLIKRVTHELDGGGYKTTIDAEKQNGGV